MTTPSMETEGHIPCPECGIGWLVGITDTRGKSVRDMKGVRRRRTCSHCNTRVTTFELPISVFKWEVEKMHLALRLVDLVTEETLDAFDRATNK